MTGQELPRDEWADPTDQTPPTTTSAQGPGHRVPPLSRRYPRRATAARYRPVQLRRPAAPTLPPVAYGSVATWVTDVLFPTYRREVLRPGFRWCPRWWAHTEAIARLEALWRAWEHQRQDPALGIAVWFRDYADPTMAALMSPTGPFTACRATRHHDRDPLPPLPQETPPEALFPDARSGPPLRRPRTPRG